MDCRCAAGWVCEQHPDRRWPHDDCPGSRIPCLDPHCPWWKGTHPAALDGSDRTGGAIRAPKRRRNR